MTSPTVDDLARVDRLWTMLEVRRPMGSRSERKWRTRWLASLPGVHADVHRNLIGRIARADGAPSTILWSSHTDTVHRVGGRQLLVWDGRRIGTDDPQSSCLGGDDTVGCWIMRELYLAGVPGLYVWHYGEEHGGVGSSELARKSPDTLTGIRAAIAFDRQGARDIVTHQAGERTCSDVFALSLARLIRPAGRYRGHRGVYTDTAEYARVVPECTNLSVGYAHQHTKYETVDPWVALRLLRAILDGWDETKLVIARDPAVANRDVWSWGRYTHACWDRDGWDSPAWDRPLLARTNGRGGNRDREDLDRWRERAEDIAAASDHGLDWGLLTTDDLDMLKKLRVM